MMTMKDMTSRQQAREAGDKYYTTNLPCKHGHYAPRVTATGCCTTCVELASKEWKKKNKDKHNAYVSEYRDRNRELIRERDRVAQAERRASNPEAFREKRRADYSRKVEKEGRTVRSFNLLTVEEVVAQLRAVHGDNFIYIGGYDGKLNTATFLCRKHDIQFDAVVNTVLRGANSCPECKLSIIAQRAETLKLSQEEFEARAKETHKRKYDYKYAVYRGLKNSLSIICPTHGVFEQVAESHLGGAGCPACYGDRRGDSLRFTLEQCKERISSVFKGTLKMITEEYSGIYTDVQVLCVKHNRVFPSKAGWLFNGSNPCTQCTHKQSREQTEINNFLSIFYRTKSDVVGMLRGKHELDIYVEQRNLAVEFHGMFYHSHFSVEHEDEYKLKSFNKYEDCLRQGIRLITVYQTEWRSHKKQIKRLLRNAIGKSKGKLMARKCELRMVDNNDARDFFDAYHPQGGAGHGSHYGLYWKDKLVACMRFTFGANDRGGAEREWTLSRYATRVNVSGGASRLFKAFLSEVGPALVKSFSDNRYFSGEMYKQLGFVLEEELPPDYQVWSKKAGLKPKSHYQRRVIPKRLRDHGFDEVYNPETDPRTEREMTYLMGAGRIYDCGKKKWVWRSQ